MLKIKAIIVDDEKLARQRLIRMLSDNPNYTVIGEAADGQSAVAMILNLKPDLVFLDIQMPRLNGFEVIQTVGLLNMPTVIFVTAYDKYAIKAFEVNAVDYLLKPFDKERFEETLKRVEKELGFDPDNAEVSNIKSLFDFYNKDHKSEKRIPLKSSGKIKIILENDIDWIESAGNYVIYYIGSQKYLVRQTMKRTEATLTEGKFVRIHRRSIVNIDRIKELKPYFNGDYIVILKDDTNLTMSRKYRHLLNHLV